MNTSAVGPVSDEIAQSPPEGLGLDDVGEAAINPTDAGVFDANACRPSG